MTDEPVREGDLLDLQLTGEKQLVDLERARATFAAATRLGDYKIMRGVSWIQDFRRLGFGLFREMLAGSCRNHSWKERGLGDLVDLQGQPPQSTGMIHLNVQKVKQAGKRPAWMNTEILAELRHKEDAQKVEAGIGYLGGMQTHDHTCRNGVRKAKA